MTERRVCLTLISAKDQPSPRHSSRIARQLNVTFPFRLAVEKRTFHVYDHDDIVLCRRNHDINNLIVDKACVQAWSSASFTPYPSSCAASLQRTTGLPCTPSRIGSPWFFGSISSTISLYFFSCLSWHLLLLTDFHKLRVQSFPRVVVVYLVVVDVTDTSHSYGSYT